MGRCPWQGSSTPASGKPSGPQGKQPRPAPLRTPALQGDQDCLPGQAQGRHSLECRLTDVSLPVYPPQIPCQSEEAGSPQSGQSSTRFPRACGRRPAGPGEGSARPRSLWCPGSPATATVWTGPPGVPWTSWSSPVPHADGGRLPAEPTHRKAGVYNSKLPCQTQVHGAAQGVPKPLAHGLHDGAHVVPFELTAESASPVSWGPETGSCRPQRLQVTSGPRPSYRGAARRCQGDCLRVTSSPWF